MAFIYRLTSGSLHFVSGVERTGWQWMIQLVGHSFIFWSAKYAGSSAWGRDLGLGPFLKLSWIGQSGMCRRDFTELLSVASFSTAPDVLLTHVGGNDVAKQSGKSLVLEILRDLRSWKTKYLSSRIV